MCSCVFCSNICGLSDSKLLVLLNCLLKPFLLTRVCETEDIIPLSFKQILSSSALVPADTRCHLSYSGSLSVSFGLPSSSYFSQCCSYVPILFCLPLPIAFCYRFCACRTPTTEEYIFHSTTLLPSRMNRSTQNEKIEDF